VKGRHLLTYFALERKDRRLSPAYLPSVLHINKIITTSVSYPKISCPILTNIHLFL